MSLTTLHCFSGTFTLQRRPAVPNQPLQAWDAADEYLLETVDSLAAEPARVLVINDTFGALAIALHSWSVHTWGDSFIAELALRENLRCNNIDHPIPFIPSTVPPPGIEGRSPAGDLRQKPSYGLVLWRIPRSVSFWQQQLTHLQPLLAEHTVVLVGGMVKHLPAQTKDILSQLGTVETFLAQKKARLFRVFPRSEQPVLRLPEEKAYAVPEYGLELATAPNVFAREKLDGGAELLLQFLPQVASVERVADLGCGNGVLGLAIKRLHVTSEVHFFDESYQAVALAKSNYLRNGFGGTEPDAFFWLDDGLHHYTGTPFDLILCNPPFHQGYVIGDQIAWQMFTQSRRHLRPGGELWIVGNRHLNYHIKLKRLFGNCRVIGSNPRFVVLAAHRESPHRSPGR